MIKPQDLHADLTGLPGRLIVVSGPSGCGKSTLVRRGVERLRGQVRISVSATTRPMRAGEEEGVHYYFLSREAFTQMRDRGGFLECALVHGNWYGTPLDPVRQLLATGLCVILEIDVQGAMLVKQRVANALLIFIQVTSLDTLESRLRARATDDEATIRKRLANAHAEIAQAVHYDVQVLNDRLDQAVDDLVGILSQQGCGGSNRDA